MCRVQGASFEKGCLRAGSPHGCSDSLAFSFPSLSSKSARPRRERRRSLGECGEDWLEHSAGQGGGEGEGEDNAST